MLPWFQAQTCIWMSICVHFFFLSILLFVIMRSVMNLPFCQGHLKFCLREEKMLLSTFDTFFQNGKHLFMLYFLIVTLAWCHIDLNRAKQASFTCVIHWYFPILLSLEGKTSFYFSSFFSPHLLLSLSFVLQVVEGSLGLCRCRNI